MDRLAWKQAVFERSKNKCVVCDAIAVDAHHIMDRSLFIDGGYFIGNGVALCADCHLSAEKGEFSPEELREIAGITEVVLPSGCDPYTLYNKWGQARPTGRIKYPHTLHLPWSPGTTNFDTKLENTDHFIGQEIVVTEKMDGENTTMYSDYIHARSPDSKNHVSREKVKAIHSSIKSSIPNRWRISAENVAAKHSIWYENLPAALLVFGIWDQNNMYLSWSDVEIYSGSLSLSTVPVLWQGIWSEEKLRALQMEMDFQAQEGYVVRLAKAFHYEDFGKSVAKYVRKNHVQTTQHWLRSKMVWNKVKKVNSI